MRIPALAVMALILTVSPSFAEETISGNQIPREKEELVANLNRENLLLREKLREYELTPSVTSVALSRKNYQRLQELARDAKAQRQTMVFFEGFVKWMTANLSGYAKYIEAGSVAAGFAKVLPIPYAGQASVFTKFVSQGVLSLNSASVAIAKYLETSQQLVTRVEGLERLSGDKTAEIAAVSRFADEHLLADMTEVQHKMVTTAEISTAALSFLESLNYYMGSTDEYWSKTKSLLKRGDSDKKERGYLSENTQNLRNRAAGFNEKLKLFDDVARKDTPLIKSLVVYDELIREMEAKALQARSCRVPEPWQPADLNHVHIMKKCRQSFGGETGGEGMHLDPELAGQLRRVLTSLELLLPKPVAQVDWQVTRAANWRRHSFAGFIEPLEMGDTIRLDDLLGIDEQKRVVENNTRQFLAGFPANNVLLWGTRGTGKSSLVRALLSSYAPAGLRVIQVDKSDLVHLPDIVDQIKGEPFKYIVFSDDVSFEPGDDSYKMLKSALDGSVYAPPENVLIYVTSNRRHLLPEYESDNLGALLVKGEIHHGEGVEEKISLSGRFGLWVGFHPFSQDQYLEVVQQWVEKLRSKAGVNLEWGDEGREEAILWSQKKGDRSGRIAYQFATQWVGTHLLQMKG